MDPDVEIVFGLTLGAPLSMDAITVDLCNMYNRQSTDSQHEAAIEEIWKRRTADNPSLFNDTKFRLHSAEYNQDHVKLMVGITDYKDFLGTNLSPHVQKLRQIGLKNLTNTQAHMSDPLGIGAFVLTKDDHFLLLKRNVTCAEAQCLWDRPGGHPEPKELLGDLHQSDIAVTSLSGTSVVNEIFQSTLREIRDEVNIPLDCLETPWLLGIQRNTTNGGKPSLEFLVRCSLTTDEILQAYQQGTQTEAGESTSIQCVSVSLLEDLKHQNPVLWNSLAPCAKACVILARNLNI